MARPLMGMGRLGPLVLLLLVAAVFLREAVQAKTAPSRGRVDRVGRSGEAGLNSLKEGVWRQRAVWLLLPMRSERDDWGRECMSVVRFVWLC